jgi:ABC-type nickel/cobalt efflux system permease component RcnA
MKFRELLISVLAVGMAACLLSYLVSIWVYGKFYIFESNKFILTIETLMLLAIISFGLYLFFSDLNSRSMKRMKRPY